MIAFLSIAGGVVAFVAGFIVLMRTRPGWLRLAVADVSAVTAYILLTPFLGGSYGGALIVSVAGGGFLGLVSFVAWLATRSSARRSA